VLEECITEEQRSFVRFLWAKQLNAKNIYKEMFPVCRVKRLTTELRNVTDIFLTMKRLKRRCGSG
jgi:hypothetical protein